MPVPAGWLKPAPKPVSIFSFGTPGAYASGTVVGTKGETLTCVRAGSAWYKDAGGTWQTATANQFRVAPQGLLVESAATQLYPTPTAPASGTATLTATGNHTFWVEGTGSQQISAGTATCTGLPATASYGKPVTFNCTVTGTVTLAAVTGSLTAAQIEKGSFGTSFIPTNGTTRNGDTISFTTPAGLNLKKYAVGLDVRPPLQYGWQDAATNNFLAGLGGFAAANASNIRIDPGGSPSLKWIVLNASSADKTLAYVMQLAPGEWYSAHRIVGLNVNGSVTLFLNGTSLGSVSGAGDGLPASFPATSYLGNAAGSFAYGAFIKNVRLGPTALTAWFNIDPAIKIAALGDSITLGTSGGGTRAYSTKMGEPAYLGSGYRGVNFGVSGDTSDQILVRWRSQVSGQGFNTLVVMAGTNDMLTGTPTAAHVEANLTTIYTEALAAGMRVLALTILPYKPFGWTAGKQTETNALNAWILSQSLGANFASLDLYTPFNAGDDTMSLTYDSGDHVHPNQAGNDYMATLITAAGHSAGWW